MVILLVLGAFVMELIDSSLGMFYGTVLSPALLLLGYDPKVVVPAILLSQAIGGFSASIFHHKNGNANFLRGEHLKSGLLVAGLGMLATVFAAFIAVNIPKDFLGKYIGIVVLIMGVIVLFGRKFSFSPGKMAGLAIFSAFNKSLSGGGYGPVMTSGQVVIGREGKAAISVTTFAEAPICLAGFVVYWLSGKVSDWGFILPLCFGALTAGIVGPFLTARFKNIDKLKVVLGIMTLMLGILVIFVGIKT